MSEFIPSLKLNQLFYEEIIRPLLHQHFPNLPHSAARLGGGSDVLGYDTPMSTDHDWGIRQQLFLTPANHQQHSQTIDQLFRQQFPYTYQGFTVHFTPPDTEGSRVPSPIHDGPVEHRVEITTIQQFFNTSLNFDPFTEPTVYDWLTIPQQFFLELTKGQIYHDGLNQLHTVRQKIAWYPHDVWLYLLMAQWTRIGQEEPFLGRTGFVGDDLGSQLLAGRLVHDIMLLCFLMERTYAPYAKWFGTAFNALNCAPKLNPILRQVLLAEDWQTREKHLCSAYEYVGRKHNALNITEFVEPTVRPFHDRPFQVIDAGRFCTALHNAITDPTIRNIQTPIGSIDQFSDNTDLRSYPNLHKRLQILYK
jgi:hypothetical protein